MFKKDRLTAREQAFITAYIDPKNNYNATEAYMITNPNVTRGSASVLATKMMQRPHVKEAIASIQGKEMETVIASRETLLQEAHDIQAQAITEGKLQVALNAVREKGRLIDAYSHGEKGLDNYRNLLQTLIINGDVNIGESRRVIDVSKD